MVKVNVIVNKSQTRDKLGRFQKSLGEFRDRHLGQIAELVTSVSPVDTGTYITSHEITPGTSGTYTSTSHGKPRRQPREPFEGEGLMNLLSDIQALPEDTPTVALTNNSEHKQSVEDKYGVYAIVKREVASLARGLSGNV